MYTDHGWCGYSIPYVFWAIGIGLEQCDNQQLVWPSRWLFSLNNFACKMYIGQNQCFLVNSLRQCLNRSNCVHTTHQMIEGLGWCCMSLANVACQMYTCHVHAYMPWMLSHTFVKHYLQDRHIPHPCVPTLEGRRLLLGAHMPGQMHAILGWCFFSFADIWRVMCVGYK